MKILIELETTEAADLAALAALADSLGGRTAPPTRIGELHVEVTGTAPPAGFLGADMAPPSPPAASESLIEQEAARAATAPPVDANARDVNGLPWDARIHAGTGAKNADGSWRGRRGVDPAIVASVTAELKAAQTPDAAFAPPAGAEAPSAPVPPPPAAEETYRRVIGAPAGDLAPPSAPAAAADTPPAGASDDAITYPKIIKMVGQKGLTYDQLNTISATFGLPGFKELVGRPDLFESFVAALPE